MLLNDDIGDIEKPHGICLLTFVIDQFSGLFVHSWIYSMAHSGYKLIINSSLLEFWYELNSNTLVSSEGIITLQKYFHVCIQFKIESDHLFLMEDFFLPSYIYL